jgi:hypothetical protein
MAFELDPLFHTETMAKILQSQGHVQLALKVCHQILEKDPTNTRVKELSEKWKPPFYRPETLGESPAGENPLESEDENTEPGIHLDALQEQGAPRRLPQRRSFRNASSRKLQALHKIQEGLIGYQEENFGDSRAQPEPSQSRDGVCGNLSLNEIDRKIAEESKVWG